MGTTEFEEIIERCACSESLAQMAGQTNARGVYIVGEVQEVSIRLDTTYAENYEAGVVVCQV